MQKTIRRVLCGLGVAALLLCCVLWQQWSPRVRAQAETEAEELTLYSGAQEDVTFSVPQTYAAPQAQTAVNLLGGISFFSELNGDNIALKGYTGYLYGAANLTFTNPIEDVHKVKSMTIECMPSINHGYDYDDIIYFEENGNEVRIPYFRLYAVNSDGSVNTEQFFSFNTNNVKQGNDVRQTLTLNSKDVRKLANDEGRLETLHWSSYTVKSTYFGFSYIFIYKITYELFAADDYRNVTFKDGDVVLRNAEIAYTLSQSDFPQVSKAGYKPVWKTENGDVYEADSLVEDDLILNLAWVNRECTLRFDSKGGNRIEPIVAEYGSAITAPENPSRSGYKFGGWYEDEECTIKFELTSMGEDRTVYAKWVPEKKPVASASSPDDKKCGCSSNANAGISTFVGAGIVLLCAAVIIAVGKKGKKSE